MCCWSFSSFYTYRPHRPQVCALDAARALRAARRDVALVQCAASGAGGVWAELAALEPGRLVASGLSAQ
jgi:hypothetical protein